MTSNQKKSNKYMYCDGIHNRKHTCKCKRCKDMDEKWDEWYGDIRICPECGRQVMRQESPFHNELGEPETYYWECKCGWRQGEDEW